MTPTQRSMRHLINQDTIDVAYFRYARHRKTPTLSNFYAEARRGDCVGEGAWGMTPTQRSLKYVRGLGWEAQVVEHFNTFAGVRVDLWGCIDILCLLPNHGGVTGIQTCRTDDMSTRIHKIDASATMLRFVRAGNRLLVIGWAQRGPRGKRKLWQPRVVEAGISEFYGRPPELKWWTWEDGKTVAGAAP